MMKALSVRQPWAELIASGRKSIELRTWSTNYRGPLIIVASLARHSSTLHQSVDGPRGVTVCVAELVNVELATASDATDAAFDTIPDGLFAWRLTSPRRLLPLSVKGKLSLFELDADAFVKLAAAPVAN